MKMIHLKDHQSKSNLLVGIAVVLGVFIFITYITTRRVTGLKLNALFYTGLYFQIMILSGVLLIYIKNIIVKLLLIVNTVCFFCLLLIYGYNMFYGKEKYSYFGIALSLGLIMALGYIVWKYWRSR